MKYTVFALITLIVQAGFSMVGALRPPTEAGFCIGCGANSSFSRAIQSIPEVATQTERVYNAAYYTDNDDRSPLSELRVKDPSQLTEIERAILQAADRAGFVFLPGCQSGNNAFLINVNGRDAIVTAGHTVTNNLTYSHKCESDEEAFFYPNMGHYNRANGKPAEDSFEMRRVRLEPNPINFNEVNGNRSVEKDFLVYFLEENVSNDTMPNGNTRGFIPFSTEYERRGQTYIIGFDSRDEETRPRQMTYQECNFRQAPSVLGLFSHVCDTSPGSSGSLLGTIENGELTFQALNVQGQETYDTQTPRAPSQMNTGVSSELVKRAIQAN